MTIIPLCVRCEHLKVGRQPMTCEAFPGGIPRAILLAEADHTRPYPGDRGITFAPRDDGRSPGVTSPPR